MAAPIPFDAPVTSAVLPASIPMGLSLSFGRNMIRLYLIAFQRRFALVGVEGCAAPTQAPVAAEVMCHWVGVLHPGWVASP